MNELPTAYHRCLGVNCEIRTSCERYLQREVNVSKITNVAKTMNSHNEPECFFMIRRVER